MFNKRNEKKGKEKAKEKGNCTGCQRERKWRQIANSTTENKIDKT